MAISSRLRLGVFGLLTSITPVGGVGQGIFGAIFQVNFSFPAVIPIPLTVIPA